MVDDDDARAERGDVVHVVRREQHRRARAARCSVRMNSRTASCIETSSPIVGSSRKSTLGRCRRAAASSHFIRSPSESWRVGFFAMTRRGRAARRARPSSRRRRLGRRRRWRGSARTSRRAARSQRSCCFCPMTSVMRSKKRARGAAATWPATRDLAGRRVEQPREHLQRRRLAGAVRPEEPDALARLDREREIGDRAHLFVRPPKDERSAAHEARRTLVHAVYFREASDRDGGVHRGEGSTPSAPDELAWGRSSTGRERQGSTDADVRRSAQRGADGPARVELALRTASADATSSSGCSASAGWAASIARATSSSTRSSRSRCSRQSSSTRPGCSSASAAR